MRRFLVLFAMTLVVVAPYELLIAACTRPAQAASLPRRTGSPRRTARQRCNTLGVWAGSLGRRRDRRVIREASRSAQEL